MEVDLMMLELLLLFEFRLVKVVLPEFHFDEFDIVSKIKKHNLREWSKKNVPTTASQKKNWKKIHMDGAAAQTYVRPTQGRAVTHKHTNKRTFQIDPAP